MKRCPHCQSEQLLRSKRSGVETDYCPQCRTWLGHEKPTGESKQETGMKDPASSDKATRPPPPTPEDSDINKNM